jgi:hypothetical protein
MSTPAVPTRRVHRLTPCRFRKTRFEHSDGVVRQRPGTRQCRRTVRRAVCRAHPSRAKRGSEPHCNRSRISRPMRGRSAVENLAMPSLPSFEEFICTSRAVRCIHPQSSLGARAKVRKLGLTGGFAVRHFRIPFGCDGITRRHHRSPAAAASPAGRDPRWGQKGPASRLLCRRSA